MLPRELRPDLLQAARSATSELDSAQLRDLFAKPLIVLSAPRSGSTLLFEQLMTSPGLWSIGGESHGVFRAFPSLHAENENHDSGRLTAMHADAQTGDGFRRCLATLLRDHSGQPWLRMPASERPESVSLVEKTPRNALNLPFLLELFPEARFVLLHRDPRGCIASLVEAWELGLQSGRFVTFRNLPGWDRSGWCFLLPRGWRELIGQSLFDIAAFQWAASNAQMLDDIATVDEGRVHVVSYEKLVADSAKTINGVLEFAGHPGSTMQVQLPLSRTTVSAPAPDKWRRFEREIETVRPRFEEADRRLQALVAERAG